MPVSTTHSCVGGMAGIAIAAYGGNAVKWAPPSSDFPYVGGFMGVVISWFLSPIFSGALAMFLFFFIRRFILRSKEPFNRAVILYPIFVFMCVTIITLFMLLKGIKSSKDVKSLSLGAKFGIAFGV